MSSSPFAGIMRAQACDTRLLKCEPSAFTFVSHLRCTAATPNVTNIESLSRLLAFHDSLTPEQKSAFEQLHFFAGVPATPPTYAANENPTMASPAQWYRRGAGSPTATEVLLITVLLVVRLSARQHSRALDDWLRDVETDAARMDELGAMWYPPPKAAGAWNATVRLALCLCAAHSFRLCVARFVRLCLSASR